MKYKIIDRQIAGREFADGATFSTPEEVRAQLVSYHSIDSTDPEQLERMTLEEVCAYGEWEIDQIS